MRSDLAEFCSCWMCGDAELGPHFSRRLAKLSWASKAACGRQAALDLDLDFELVNQTEAVQTCLFTSAYRMREPNPDPENRVSCSNPHHTHCFKSS